MPTQISTHDSRPLAHLFPYGVMALAPLFFSTNLIFGRGLAGAIDPFLLAFLRWLSVGLLLFPLVWRERAKARAVVTGHWRLLIALGFFGMWISGAIVYLALQHTTATNGTLIYTTSPLMILLIEALFLGRAIGRREVAGMVLAFSGVAYIVLKGNLGALLHLDLNSGDLLIALAALSWACYSVLYRRKELAVLSNLALFGIVALFGAATLAPFVMVKAISGALPWPAAGTWPSLAGIVVFSSLAAFSMFQFGVRRLGATVAGIFMYLLPPYGVLLAVTVLGETLMPYHFWGIVTVVGGIVLATFPAAVFRRNRAPA